MDLKNKIAVITGGFRGSGAEVIKLFIENNYKVYSLDKNFKKKIEYIENNVNYKIDLSDFNQIKRFANFIKKKEKKIDCLINNAGISLVKNKNINTYWNKTLSVNLNAIFFITEFLLPLLKKSKFASIVNISSISSKVAMSKNPAYNAAKAGVLALTASQALDYSNFKIRSNAICPGYIKTNMTKKSFQNIKLRNERLKRLIIKRYGEPEEVANLVHFLCTEKSKYINGQDIVIDGGLTKRGI